ncbi:ATP synthase F1 subunit delta, partial [Candidatus Saccharibacteria bacterium]|nr:ATP synthase F1 subunit delta [Candidatus Saccharibacteria bacterium]NIW78285.1 ATP synthase F1 subunit delta [Calditrichia bacterium]
LARENQNLEQIESDLNLLDKEYQMVKEFQTLINSPVVPNPVKQDLFSKLFKEKLHSITFNFFSLLIIKNREAIMSAIISYYRELLDQYRGIARCDVYSVTRLSDAQLENLKSQLDTMTGKNVVFTQKIDEDLLGGLMVKLNDTVYDTSLRYQLERLKQNLITEE